uniref:DNA translocase FtsK 4TM region domain-containing protein n=1 Tax=Florenciella sp. virus SA2 TaxID=3240092 RepID=A0AB39JDZ5_9VIRU
MEKTTNINTLPIKQNITPPLSQPEAIEKIDRPESNITIDNEIPIYNNNQKRVKFEDEQMIQESSMKDKKNPVKSNVFSLENKIILLAGVLFFIFIDIKFKKYIINILTQIFGNFLKTETGGTSYIGSFFYSITFVLVLYLFNRFIDLTSINLS